MLWGRQLRGESRRETEKGATNKRMGSGQRAHGPLLPSKRGGDQREGRYIQNGNGPRDRDPPPPSRVDACLSFLSFYAKSLPPICFTLNMAKRRASVENDSEFVKDNSPVSKRPRVDDADPVPSSSRPQKADKGKSKRKKEGNEEEDAEMGEPDDEEQAFEEKEGERIRDSILNKSKTRGVSPPVLCYMDMHDPRPSLGNR